MRSFSRHYSTIDVKSIVLHTKISEVKPMLKTKSKSKTKEIRKQDRHVGKDIINELNRKYNEGYSFPSASALSNVNFFFNRAAVTFEWSAPKFEDIPSEKIRNIIKERHEDAQKAFEEDEEFALQIGNSSLKNSTSFDSFVPPDKNNTKMYPGKTNGIPFELINGLPEIAFLGRCNVGKSTLLNNLTTMFSRNSLVESAYSSRTPGYTKTLNCFNVGKKFRIIDTPGYGIKGTAEQGRVTMDYLKNRRELRRSFLLINGSQGFNDFDIKMIEIMVNDGIPFELVFTKMDKIQNTDRISRMLEDSGILSLPTSPRLIFLNSITNKFCDKRYGIDILRYTIFEACGLPLNARPSKTK